MTDLADLLVGTGAVGAAVVGGVLYAFSAFGMPGLRNAEPRVGMAAMQEMNRMAPRAPLVVPLMLTAALSAGLAVAAVLGRVDDRWWVLAGCLLYLAAFAITVAFHVPRNEALDRVDVHGPDAVEAWHQYAGAWVRWNHVRSAAAIAGSASLVVALVR
ncbi:anthrone oxygenase family protein [Nocardioides donggukensis]|uniref:DUF1772 domain-containing protein n=1 Tax=Nocardioides donggukensis TaxID=2774019 RepID=A0A927Q0M8_9ACTN|nr:anthrone oxygenase family protein [Nocardioides donggukensis]MBD8869117.1 DUF1772 domain-containing protein [Nocardioides donggukensis]